MNNKINKNSLYKEKKRDLFINIYGFMAIIFVIIPEWIAEYWINIDNVNYQKLNNSLENPNNKLLIIYSMDMKELRLTAYKMGIKGYARENKHTLRKRIVFRMKKKKILKSII
tara:strand:- start:31 stop:369 length:339 start_codon:yes stop_codon:yes gene_type:complete